MANPNPNPNPNPSPNLHPVFTDKGYFFTHKGLTDVHTVGPVSTHLT